MILPTGAHRVRTRTRTGGDRRLRLLAASLLFAAQLFPALVSAPADAADPPVTVTITGINPVVPTKGSITIHGRITTSGQTASGVQVTPEIPGGAITSSDELAQAAESAGSFYGTAVSSATLEVGDVAANTDKDFTLTLPSSDLAPYRTPGVYEVAVTVNGSLHNAKTTPGSTDPSAGSTQTLATAQTFVPLVAGTHRTVKVSVVLPFRATVRRTWDNQLRNEFAWAREVSQDGRVGRLLGLAQSGAGQGVTLLVDPAVLDAIGTVAQTPTTPYAATPSPSPTPGTTVGKGAASAGDVIDAVTRRAAADWLRQFQSLASQVPVLSLGYADPDVAALASRSPRLLRDAFVQAAQALQTRRVSQSPAVAPTDGYLDTPSLRHLPKGSTVLLSDQGTPHDQVSWKTPRDGRLLFTDRRAVSGVPVGTKGATQALGVRQRLLSEAALSSLGERTLSSGTSIVALLPQTWDPGPDWRSADFFGALQQPWLHLVGLPTRAGSPPYSTALDFPTDAVNRLLGQSSVRAAKRLIRVGSVYADTLAEPGRTATNYARVALEAVSTNAQANPRRAILQTRQISRRLEARLRGVKVEGSPFITMSGNSGTFVVSLVNTLDVPVSVGLRAHTHAGLDVGKISAVQLPPGQRATVRVEARATRSVVQVVTLTPVNRAGEEVGSPLTFRLRISEVSALVWGIMGAGAVLLVVMIARRLILRGLHSRAEDNQLHPQLGHTAPETSGGDHK